MKKFYPLFLFLLLVLNQNALRGSGLCSVTITNFPQPVILGCNDSVILTCNFTSSSPVTNYVWSNTEVGYTQNSITVNQAGNYSVTVTDTSGCSATADVVVELVQVSDSVSFLLPSQIGEYGKTFCPLTFTNTSQKFSPPWIAIFNPGYGMDNDTIYNGDSDIIYTYYNVGIYEVTLTMDSAGCSFSETRELAIITNSNNNSDGDCTLPANAIIEISNNSGLSLQIFPNPSSDKLSITVNGFVPEYLSLYDMNGRKLSEQKFAKQIDISALPAGVYFIEVSGENNTLRNKVVKISGE